MNEKKIKRIKRKVVLIEVKNLFQQEKLQNKYLSKENSSFTYNNTRVGFNLNHGMFGLGIEVELRYYNSNNNYEDKIYIKPFRSLMYFKILRFHSKQFKIHKKEKLLESLQGLPEHVKLKLNMKML